MHVEQMHGYGHTAYHHVHLVFAEILYVTSIFHNHFTNNYHLSFSCLLLTLLL